MSLFRKLIKRKAKRTGYQFEKRKPLQNEFCSG